MLLWRARANCNKGGRVSTFEWRNCRERDKGRGASLGRVIDPTEDHNATPDHCSSSAHSHQPYMFIPVTDRAHLLALLKGMENTME